MFSYLFIHMAFLKAGFSVSNLSEYMKQAYFCSFIAFSITSIGAITLGGGKEFGLMVGIGGTPGWILGFTT